MHWVGEGFGQLISLQLNSSRQLAGGVCALVCTVLTGSFPLLQGLGLLFNMLSWLSFVRCAPSRDSHSRTGTCASCGRASRVCVCARAYTRTSHLCAAHSVPLVHPSFGRWGMVALTSVEFAPWYVGEPTQRANPSTHGHQPGCCALPRHLVSSFILNPTGKISLDVHCASTQPGPSDDEFWYPSSRHDALHIMNASYQYDAWLPQAAHLPGTLDASGHPVKWGVADFYPLPGSRLANTTGLYTPQNAGFSLSAFASLLILGLATRVLVYVSLRCMDRTRRR